MMLNLTEVLLDGKTIHTEVPAGLERLEYGFGSYPVTEKTPVRLSAEKKDENHLLIGGKAEITVEAPCDRCLESVAVPLVLEFSETIPAGAAESPAEAQDEPVKEDGDDESPFEPDYCMEGYHLDVDKLLSGEALLNWPSRILCKEDCKGLCPVCGQNLNRGDCGCERKALDPRMAKVLDVFSKFKEV